MTGKFHRIRELADFPRNLRGGAVAIGNFDGVHRGHRAVLDGAVDHAQQASLPALVLTFEPHPRTFFAPKRPVYRMTPAPLKARLFAQLGFSAVVELEFNHDLASLDAEKFVDSVLLAGMGVSHVVVGEDFHFGRMRKGTPKFLQEIAASSGFSVTLIGSYDDEGGEKISSTRIRQALADGELPLANGLLGYRFTISGEVVAGRKKGRELGYPTANIQLPLECCLKFGIYAVLATRANGERMMGVASYGRRPTFDNGAVLFESHLFDFAGDLYGETISLELCAYLREEAKFDTIEELVTQMDEDTRQAQAFLATLGEHHSGLSAALAGR